MQNANNRTGHLMAHQSRTETAANPVNLVPLYMAELRRTDFTRAYNLILTQYGWDAAQAVSWQCLAEKRTERVNGRIVGR